MSNAKATIEAARGWHKFGFAISATALILLFAPQKADLGAALSEAYTLRELPIESYERFVSGFIGQNKLLPPRRSMAPGDWPVNITAFLNAEMGQNVIRGNFPNPTWNIDVIVDYERPPVDKTIADWFRWITSSQPASYYHPDWKTASLSMSRGGAASPLVRHFSVRPSRFQRSAGEYTFEAYLDLRITSNDQSEYVNRRASREDWWSELENVDFLSLKKKQSMDLGSDRWVIEGDVDSVLMPVHGKTGINHWLRQSGIWQRLSNTNNLGEAVLPGIREHWPQLEGMTLAAAISYMEGAQKEVGSVSLLGAAVPGELLLVAIPLAYLLVHLSLLLDIRFLRSLQHSNVDVDPSDAPWMGLYDDTLAVWATAISIAVVPVLLTLGLLLRYHSIVDKPVLALSIVALATAAAIQILVFRETTSVRKALRASPTKS